MRLSDDKNTSVNRYRKPCFLILNRRYAPNNFLLIVKQTKKIKKGRSWVEGNENRIYIRGEFTRKKCKTAILLYCFHTGGILHIFMLFNLLGPGILFYRKSKINIKRKPNYEIGWFTIDQWSFHIDDLCISFYKRWFFVITLNQMMFFIHLIHCKVYLTALKNSKLKWIVKGTYCINVLYCI